jgi:hypothetical protein
MLVDPRDEELPDVGLASFEDLETGEEVVVDTSDPRVREHYGKTMQSVRRSARSSSRSSPSTRSSCAPTGLRGSAAQPLRAARGGCDREARRVSSALGAIVARALARAGLAPSARRRSRGGGAPADAGASELGRRAWRTCPKARRARA